MVRDGDNGLLVPVRDPHALASAIERLLGDPGRRQEMGRSGRRRAEQLFDVQLIVRATLDVYDRVAAG
ncbi:MAG: glycosyltransferase family 4 protein [Rhodospirillales bacterium]|nr:glycosyltransferase family 4 protein [Rhodospirillales bacterium]